MTYLKYPLLFFAFLELFVISAAEQTRLEQVGAGAVQDWKVIKTVNDIDIFAHGLLVTFKNNASWFNFGGDTEGIFTTKLYKNNGAYFATFDKARCTSALNKSTVGYFFNRVLDGNSPAWFDQIVLTNNSLASVALVMRNATIEEHEIVQRFLQQKAKKYAVTVGGNTLPEIVTSN